MARPSRQDRIPDTVASPSVPPSGVLQIDPGRSVGRVIVCVSPGRYAPAELVAGASLAQEIHADCYMLTVVPPTPDRFVWSPVVDENAMECNRKLAETLNITVVETVSDDPADGVLAFARREGVTHVIVGQPDSTHLWSPESMIPKLSQGLRGVEIRTVARANPEPATRARWMRRHRLVSTMALFALLALSAAAIAYVPWPLVLLLAIIVAVIWARRVAT